MSHASVPPLPISLKEDRTVAILAYLTLVGFVVAIVVHTSRRTELGAFHLRQVLGLMLVSGVVALAMVLTGFVLAVIPLIGPLVGFVLWLGVWASGLVLWLMGLVAAIDGRRTPLPVIGQAIQMRLARTFT